jgi:two-component system response regulator RegA
MAGVDKSRFAQPAPRLLVADDEDRFRDAMKKKLMTRGYHVMDVKTGRDAIRVAVSQQPEVVIMDHHLSDISGLIAAGEIKKKRPDIRVILLSGYGDMDQLADAKDNRAYKYLYKPCGITELIDAIESERQKRAEEIAMGSVRAGVLRRIAGVVFEIIMKIRNFHI